MSDPPGPDFDATRASFLLLAGVIAVHAVIVLAGVAACLIYTDEIVVGRFQCDAHDKLRDLLAAALAFLGYTRSK